MLLEDLQEGKDLKNQIVIDLQFYHVMEVVRLILLMFIIYLFIYLQNLTIINLILHKFT